MVFQVYERRICAESTCFFLGFDGYVASIPSNEVRCRGTYGRKDAQGIEGGYQIGFD